MEQPQTATDVPRGKNIPQPSKTANDNSEGHSSQEKADCYKIDSFKRYSMYEFKVLLVRTAIKHPINDDEFGVPMGLYVLKDYLMTTGHNLAIDVWDERLELRKLESHEKKMTSKQNNSLYIAQLDKKQYDAVGISMCTSEVLPALEKFRIARMKNPNIVTFCGGIFTATNEECLLKTKEVDFVIPGIGTKPLGDLLVQLCHQKSTKGVINKEAIDIYGVAKKNSSFFPQTIWKCSQLPTMRLSMWKEIATLYENDLKEKVGIYTFRGCDNECLFCSVQRESKQTIFRKKAISIITEIEYLITRGCKYFSFKDENFLNGSDTRLDILTAVQDHKIEFKIRARYDNVSSHINSSNNSYLEKLKKLGVEEIQYGIETYDSCIRKSVEKNYHNAGENKEKFIEFIKRHADSGITANCSFILGLDGETTAYYDALINFIKKITEQNRKSKPPKIYINFLTPHPYNSRFIVADRYHYVTNNLNYFTHKFPVCYTGLRDVDRNTKMLNTYAEIVNITNSEKYNPLLGEEVKDLTEAFKSRKSEDLSGLNFEELI